MTQESDGTLPAIQVHSKAPKTEQGEYGPGGRLLKKGTTSFEYDAKGRRVAKIKLADDGTEARTTYEWDGRDRLRSLKKPDGTTLTYTYDAFGRRVGKTVTRPGARPEQTAFVWDGEVLALELSAERGARTFVHEPGTFEPFLQEERGQIYLTVNDHLGMPKELISAQGEVTWSAAHSAYGRVIKVHSDGSGVESPFRLLGQVADDEAELCWTRFRCFDADVGAWISTDPLEIAGGLNLYGFDGAPTGVVDPRGLSTDNKNHPPIATPYGEAEQATTPEALAARQAVEEGATLYRIGTTGRSAGPEGQFWALEHPLSPSYPQRYGIPPENVARSNFVETATLRPGTSFVTRPAPPSPDGRNPGGGIEVVVPEGGVTMASFSSL